MIVGSWVNKVLRVKYLANSLMSHNEMGYKLKVQWGVKEEAASKSNKNLNTFTFKIILILLSSGLIFTIYIPFKNHHH